MTMGPVERRRLALLASMSGVEKPLPDLSEALLAALEDTFPERCLRRGETAEEHIRYAGKVELVAGLRAQFEDRKNRLADAGEPALEEAEHVGVSEWDAPLSPPAGPNETLF